MLRFPGFLLLSSLTMNPSTSVPSVHQPHQVQLEGFDLMEKNARMLEWVGKGRDFRLIGQKAL